MLSRISTAGYLRLFFRHSLRCTFFSSSSRFFTPPPPSNGSTDPQDDDILPLSEEDEDAIVLPTLEDPEFEPQTSTRILGGSGIGDTLDAEDDLLGFPNDISYLLHKTEGLPIHTLFCHFADSDTDPPRLLRGFTLTSHPWKAPLRRYWPLFLLSFVPYSWIPASFVAVTWFLARSELVPQNFLRRVRESWIGEKFPRYVSFVRTSADVADADIFLLGTSFVSSLRWREIRRSTEVVDAQVVTQTTISRGCIPFVRLRVRVTEKEMREKEKEWVGRNREWVREKFEDVKREVKDRSVSVGVGLGVVEEREELETEEMMTQEEVEEVEEENDNDYYVDEEEEEEEYFVVRTYYVGCEDVHEAQLLALFFREGVCVK